MIRTELCDILGIKYPIFQAGMGPFSNNQLCIATANAGVLGLLSTSGLNSRESQKVIFDHFCTTGGADPEKDDDETILRKIFRQTYNGVKDKNGVFGVNVMVSAEMNDLANKIINTAIACRTEEPDLQNNFKVVFTSAGDPMPWGEKIKGAGFKWIHVVPSVKGAERCRKAGVDIIVASGHEGGFHTSWEPVHSMVLLPAVVEAMARTVFRWWGPVDLPMVNHWWPPWHWVLWVSRWEPASWPQKKVILLMPGRKALSMPVTGTPWWPGGL